MKEKKEKKEPKYRSAPIETPKRVITGRDISKAIAAEYSNLNSADVYDLLQCLAKYINLYLENGDAVRINNLGTWGCNHHPAGIRWNPRYKDYVMCDDMYRLTYRYPLHMRRRFKNYQSEDSRPKYFDYNVIEEDEEEL